MPSLFFVKHDTDMPDTDAKQALQRFYQFIEVLSEEWDLFLS